MSKPKIYQSLAWMHRQYVTLGLTEEEIASKAGVSRVTIHQWLFNFDLLKKTRMNK